MVEQTGREKQLITFLRNLSGGYSSYRLFGGNLEQPGFVEAVGRVQNTAQPIIATGRARVQIHADRFISDEGPLPEDEANRRIAMACYERRVEEITIAAVPSTTDLAALYEVLTTPMEELEEAGGAPRALLSRGVESIRLNEAMVSATEGDGEAEGLSPEEDALALGLDRLDKLSEEFGHDDYGADANSVYKLLREVVAALPPDRMNDPDTYRRLRESVESLPDEVQTALSSVLIANVGDEPVAERIIGTMTDTSLARMLVDISKQVGGDPLELARELVLGGFRRDDLIDLASAATGQPVARDGGTGGAGGEGGRMVDPSAGGDRSNLLEAIGELVAGDLKDHTEEDERSLRADFPGTDDERLQQSLLTFSDYLRVDDDVDRLSSVLESWARATRTALKDDEPQLATTLVEVADRAYRSLLEEAPERAKLIADAKATILDQALVSELAVQGGQGDTSTLLSLFGGLAIEALLQQLADELVSTRRSTLIGMVAGLVGGDDHSVLRRWAKDERWFVARNVMTIIQRSGSASDMLSLIEIGMRHPNPAVRKEAVRALGPVGSEAIPRLVRLASDPDREVAMAATEALGSVALIAAEGEANSVGEIVQFARDTEVRKRALELLGKHPSAEEAEEVLGKLASFWSRPRIPLGLRRRAKTLLRERRANR